MRKRNVSRRGAATKPAAAASASPTANRPASRAATTKLRTGLTDHKAEAVPHSSRPPSSMAATRRDARSASFALADPPNRPRTARQPRRAQPCREAAPREGEKIAEQQCRDRPRTTRRSAGESGFARMGRVEIANLPPALWARCPRSKTRAAKDLPPSLRTDFDRRRRRRRSPAPQFSGESDPCTEFASIDSAKSFRMVPGAAFAGFVAPMISRLSATAFSPFEHLDHHRARTHKRDQIAVERALGMHFVEPLRLALRKPDALLSDDAQPAPLEAVVDRAGKIAPGRVRFDDRQSPFDGHPHLAFGESRGL